MHHKKHHKKSNPFIPAFILFILIILIGIEVYLLFFQHHPESDIKRNSSETIAKTTESTLPSTQNIQQIENKDIQPTSDFAKELNQKLEDIQFVGTALIIHNGQIILKKGFGYANFSESRLNNSQSTFQIGSIQKAFTAALISQQIQAKKLSLDDTLDQFYPTVPDSKKITIRQLLSMTSGLQQKIKPTIMMSDEDFVQFAISNATMSDYGKYRYEAVNYSILVGILEQLTGVSYRTLFTRTFIHELKLSHTCFYNDFVKSTNRTYAYEKSNNKNVASEIKDNNLTFDQEVGTGNVGMTVDDLYSFYSDLFEGKIIDQQTINELWTPETEAKYMGGLYNFSTYIKGHGNEAGFESNSMISKDRKNAVILLSNQYPKNKSHSEVVSSIFNLLGPYQSKPY
ncbi:serine hydrolase domain-containing protein [Enterococcus sp. AZ126]|uniref:serine hydrolase domain-containing protein n=1 Tax=Enterococcus sp. AZ126 TaxID=2774635 RepID=UPI003F285202